MRWTVEGLDSKAVGISASRRTDIPAWYAAWFKNRLAEGFADYIPRGPPRRVRRRLLPRDVTHFTFWSKSPAPFLGVLGEILGAGYPVLWNVTVTGLGGTVVEPLVPPAEKVVAVVKELSRMVKPQAILWRFDPVFVSREFPPEHALARFEVLCGEFAGHVDRVTMSFVEPFRRVAASLKSYEQSTGDRLLALSDGEKAALAEGLRSIAARHGIPFSLCCSPALRAAMSGCPVAGCNSWAWACRVYPDLRRHRALRAKPTRDDCGCSEEYDVGVYDTCTSGCVYSYGSCNRAKAQENRARHDPGGPCILP